MKKAFPKRCRMGFTLIELLVAMTIVAILTSLALVSIEGARKASRDGKRKTDLEQVRSALEMYRADIGSYPANRGLLSPDYLDPLPTDPISSSYSYYYERDATNYSIYRLCARLETGGGTDCSDRSCGTAGTCNYEVNNP